MTDGSEVGPDSDTERGDRPVRLPGLSLELPEHGTGARAARRAARSAATGPAGGQAVPGEERARPARGFAVADARPAAAPGAGDRAPTARDASSRRPTSRWMAGFAAILVVCVAAAGALAALGINTLRDSRAGRAVTNAEPDEPGFEGFLEPTPTLAVRMVHDGVLDAAYVLSLGSGDVGGGVLLMPADTLIGSGELGTLALTQAFGGSDEQVRGAIEIVAGVGLDDLVTIDDARWTELVGPVAPLVLDNPDDLPDFPVGPLELAAEEVGLFLRARSDGDSELSRLVRHELVWEAWLQQVAAAGPSSVPGEVDTGLGRFVRGLAAGPHQTRSLPVIEQPTDDEGMEYAVDLPARGALIVSLVPYPRGTAYAPRTLVRLLDGTGDPDHVGRVAPQVIASDSSIVVVGNADRFDYVTTQIRYHRPEHRGAAERLQEDLGAGEVIEDVRPIDSFDVTIVLGTDL